MARYSFRLPDIGEGIAEAEIVHWHVKIGDKISEDAPLADMMTDKATVEMESPVAGVVVEQAGRVGDMVSIGSTLAVIEVADENEEPSAAPRNGTEPVPISDKVVENVDYKSEKAEKKDAPEDAHLAIAASPEAMVAAEPVNSPIAAKRPENKRILASPAVRARAKGLGIDLAQVSAEGQRIRHSDLDAYLRYGSGQGYAPVSAGAVRPDEVIKIVGMRRKIAENMSASKRAIPHFTYVEEVDVTALEALRADLNEARGARPKLTLLPLLIVGICRTLPEFPMLNARFDDEAGIVTRHGAVHLGLATQTDAGLMVPVIRDAQRLNIWQLAQEIIRLAEAARTGKAKPLELSGSTLTVTSLGPLGGIATTPVINRPEVAIIGPNKIVERPVFRTNSQGIEELHKANLMNISISCDHRVVDGWDAASFIQALKRRLEKPVQLIAGE